MLALQTWDQKQSVRLVWDSLVATRTVWWSHGEDLAGGDDQCACVVHYLFCP
jgi:hypothetical protein